MDLWGTITGLVNRDSRKYIYVQIPPDHVKGAQSDGAALEAGKHYFRLWLTEMYLKKERDWFKSWYPVVHSLIRFQFGTQVVEIPHIAGPLHLDGVTDANLDRAVQLNHNLTTLMPYNGGVVELVAGLLAMEAKNYLGSALKVMGDLSGLLVVPQLSAALTIAGPIATGLQDLLSGGSGQMDLGLHQTFIGAGGGGGNELRPGYIAVVLAEEGKYKAEQFWIESDRLRYGPGQDSSQPLTGVTHMVFRIEARTERDDWAGLKTVIEARDEALKAIAADNDADSAIKRTIFLVRTSPDLTRADRKRVADALKSEFDEARQGFESASTPESFEDVIARHALTNNVDELLKESDESTTEIFQSQ
jgi:hypothetical protein